MNTQKLPTMAKTTTCAIGLAPTRATLARDLCQSSGESGWRAGKKVLLIDGDPWASQPDKLPLLRCRTLWGVS